MVEAQHHGPARAARRRSRTGPGPGPGPAESRGDPAHTRKGAGSRAPVRHGPDRASPPPERDRAHTPVPVRPGSRHTGSAGAPAPAGSAGPERRPVADGPVCTEPAGHGHSARGPAGAGAAARWLPESAPAWRKPRRPHAHGESGRPAGPTARRGAGPAPGPARGEPAARYRHRPPPPPAQPEAPGRSLRMQTLGHRSRPCLASLRRISRRPGVSSPSVSVRKPHRAA